MFKVHSVKVPNGSRDEAKNLEWSALPLVFGAPYLRTKDLHDAYLKIKDLIKKPGVSRAFRL
jgi:hypothetical protein